MTYKEARVYLDELSKYGSVLGLDTIRGLLHELGDPQESLWFIHIAGTNGKGSVLAYTSTILSEAGYRIGRYVSPTVVSYLERIQADGTWISEEMFAELTAQVREAIARLEAAGKPVPTVFEAETAIAFLYFRRMKCDLVVLEAGLGGALDATNIITRTACAVFASISMDHVGVIGDTLEEIAENKAGIIKPGCAVVSAPQSRSVTDILRSRAAQYGCPFTQADPEEAEVLHSDYRGIRLSYPEFGTVSTQLAGSCQSDNLITALETVRTLRKLGYRISDRAVRDGAAHTVWPGRFTCISRGTPLFILDGAHNEDAARRLRGSMETCFPGKRLIFIMGVFRDKDYEAVARTMCPLASVVYTVDLPDRRRGLPAGDLARAAGKYCPSVTAFPDAVTPQETETPHGIAGLSGIPKAVASALRAAGPDDVILAFGSLSYLHRVKEAYDQITKEGGTFNDR